MKKKKNGSYINLKEREKPCRNIYFFSASLKRPSTNRNVVFLVANQMLFSFDIEKETNEKTDVDFFFFSSFVLFFFSSGKNQCSS